MSAHTSLPSIVPGSLDWRVVVLNWNGREDTLDCLASLEPLHRQGVGVICVDNGSVDGSVQAISAAFPWVTLIETGANLGYSGGNNAGIQHALDSGADWVILLNNDATVRDGLIDGFQQALTERPDAGVLAGKVFFADAPDQIWFAGQHVNTRTGYSGRPRGYGQIDSDAFDTVVETGRAVGALMALSAPMLRVVGLFDDDLFAYVEDVDLSLRARDAGYGVIFAPRAQAWHRVSSSTGGEKASTHTIYYGLRNTIVVTERRRPLPWRGTWLRRLLILSSFLLYAVTRSNRFAALRAVSEGLSDALAGRLGQRGSGRAERSAARARS